MIKIDNTPIEETIGGNPNRLKDTEAQKLEGELTYKELTDARRNMKNPKSPGNDGFSAKFFKKMWLDLGVYLLRSVNYAYENGLLPVTQKQGIITCLPKPNKRKR